MLKPSNIGIAILSASLAAAPACGKNEADAVKVVDTFADSVGKWVTECAGIIEKTEDIRISKDRERILFVKRGESGDIDRVCLCSPLTMGVSCTFGKSVEGELQYPIGFSFFGNTPGEIGSWVGADLSGGISGSKILFDNDKKEPRCIVKFADGDSVRLKETDRCKSVGDGIVSEVSPVLLDISARTLGAMGLESGSANPSEDLGLKGI